MITTSFLFFSGSYCEDGAETDNLDSDASTASASSVTTPVSYDRSRRLLVDVNDSTLAQEDDNEATCLALRTSKLDYPFEMRIDSFS